MRESIRASIWWILPAAYMASDLAEDTVIAAIFKSFIPLTTGWFRLFEHPHGHRSRNDQRRHWSGRNPRRAERAVVLLSCRQGDLNECVSGVNERCTGPVP